MTDSNGRRIAWISIPAFIDTDFFAIKEMVKHYEIDFYLIYSSCEKIDFLESIKNLDSENINFNLVMCRIDWRASDFRRAICYQRILKTIKKRKYDMVYSLLFGMPYYIFMLYTILGKKKTLLGIHNVHVPRGGSYSFTSKLYNSFALHFFNYYHTFSKAQKKALLTIAPSKYCENVSHMLTDYGMPIKVRNDNRITFLSFGYIRKYKRIDVLIEAAQKIYEDTKTLFRVIIAGSSDNWDDEYQPLIKYPEIFDLRIGRVEDSEIADLFNESDYFVAPYQDIAQSGSAVVALNYNKPIVASRLEAFEEYVIDNETGFIIAPANMEELYTKMKFIIMNHENIYACLQANIKKFKKTMFSSEAIAEQYMRIFDKVID